MEQVSAAKVTSDFAEGGEWQYCSKALDAAVAAVL